MHMKKNLKKAMTILSEMENQVTLMRFGIDREGPMKLREIGDVMGVSRERVRQISVRAIRKLRWFHGNESLKSFLD